MGVRSWRSVFSAFGAVALFVIAYIAVAYVAYRIVGAGLVATVVADAFWVIAVIVWSRFCKSAAPARRSPDGIWILLFVVLAVAMYMLGQIAGTVVASFGDASFERYSETFSSAPVAVVLLVSLVLAPVSEELVFRGFVYRRMRHGAGAWVALWTSSLLFALAHGTAVHFVPTVLMSIMSCILYERTGRLWPSMVWHMMTNAASVVLPHVSLPVILFEPSVLVPLIVACVAAALFMFDRSLEEVVCDGEEEAEGCEEAHYQSRAAGEDAGGSQAGPEAS